jgi:RNA polymerase sigma-70 factor (sigma-E family)
MQTMTTVGFEELYRERQAPMVRLAYAILYDKGRAEEVVQEAFIKVARAWHRVDQPDPYLRRAVVNESISALRRRKRELLHPPDRPPIELLPEIDETWSSLQRLSPKQRTALALRFYLDLPIKDVAAAMSIPVGTAKSTIHRGLAALKEVLEP